MEFTWRLVCSCAILLAMAPSSFGGAPDLQSVTPAGVRRGTDVQLVLSGARLEDAQGVLFYRPGVTIKRLAVEGAVVKADCSIAADCVLGEMPLRLRTASGISDLRTVWIGALPVVAEAEPNNDFAAPQAILLDATVNGVITSEDVDHFVVQAKQGQRITAEVEGMRLARAMFDPRVAILDAKRFELASCDDSTLLLQDPVASIVAPADGSYVVQIREASFGGSNACAYRLHIGTFPRPTVCFPPGGTAGQPLTAQLRGDAAGDIAATIALPGERIDRFAYFPNDAAGAAPSPVWVRVVNYPCVVEQPGAPASQASQPAAPAPPIAFDGVLDAPQQADVLRFHATKGQVLDVRCVARALRSPLDAVIDIMDASGAVRASSDDVGGADPSLRFTAIADGDLSIRVRDQRGRGGPLFVYHLEIEPPQPSISAALERLDGRRPQFLQSLSVPRGGQMAAMIRVERKEVDGPAVIEPAELPKGVTLIADELPAGQALLPVVFQAAADAPLDGGLYRFGVRLKREGGDVVGQLRQTMPLVIGAPNDTVYYQTTVDSLAVAAAEPTPFRVQLVVPPAGVLRDGAAQLKVIVERQADFAENVVVHMLWNPPGISSSGSITITKDQTEAAYPLNAAGDAPLLTHKLALLAQANAGGDRWCSSLPAPITVSDVFATGKLQLAAIERGKSGAALCKIEQRRPWEGVAKLVLQGLPAKVSATPVEIAAGATEAVFPIATEADAPVGQHSGLFCELTAIVGGQPVTHRLAMGGAIRIDAPPVVAAAPAPPPPPQPAAPAATPPKPLSRLEQLRKEADERAAASQPAKGTP